MEDMEDMVEAVKSIARAIDYIRTGDGFMSDRAVVHFEEQLERMFLGLTESIDGVAEALNNIADAIEKRPNA